VHRQRAATHVFSIERLTRFFYTKLSLSEVNMQDFSVIAIRHGSLSLASGLLGMHGTLATTDRRKYLHRVTISQVTIYIRFVNVIYADDHFELDAEFIEEIGKRCAFV
jgi:hypothetical protein